MPQIKVTIDAMGKPSVEAIGYTGRACTDATSAIERALAGPGEMVKVYKPEFDQIETVDQTNTATTGW